MAAPRPHRWAPWPLEGPSPKEAAHKSLLSSPHKRSCVSHPPRLPPPRTLLFPAVCPAWLGVACNHKGHVSGRDTGRDGLPAPPHSGPHQLASRCQRCGPPTTPGSQLTAVAGLLSRGKAPPAQPQHGQPLPPTNHVCLPSPSRWLLSSPGRTLRFSNQFLAAPLPRSPSLAPGTLWPPMRRPVTPDASGQPDPSSQDCLAQPPSTISTGHSGLGPTCPLQPARVPQPHTRPPAGSPVCPH